jgi:hypothetical protein
MHLQWFAEELPEQDDDGDNTLTFEDAAPENDRVEVVVGEPEPEEETPVVDAEFAGKSKEELVEIVRQARSATKPDQTEALLQGFDKISNTLARSQQQAPVQQAPERDPAEVLREQIIESPDKALDYYFAKKIQPDVQRLLSGNLSNSRKFAKLNPETKWVMDEYGAEVEDEIARMPPAAQLQNPDVYEEACNRVKLKHVDVIIERQVAERLKKVSEGEKKPKPAGATYSEVGTGRPAPAVRRVYITAEQEREERRSADAHGVEWENWVNTSRFQNKYGGGRK